MARTEVEADADTWSTKQKELLTEQPGLEVVPHELLRNTDHLAQARPPESAKYTVPTCEVDRKIRNSLESGAHSPQPVSTDFPEVADLPQTEAIDQPGLARRQKKRILIIASVVLVAIAVSAVLGGVLGSNAARQRETSANDENTASTNTSGNAHIADLGYNAIGDAASLAVTARKRRDGSSEGWLFYEDWSRQPRMLRWDTKRGGVLKAPASFTLEPAPPEYGGRKIWSMAASTILHGSEYNPGVNLFISTKYLGRTCHDPDAGSGSQVIGFDFDSEGNQTNKTRISEKQIATNSPDTSAIAAYWPWIVHGYQESNSNNQPPNNKWIAKLAEARNQLDSSYEPGADWNIRNLTIEAKLTSKLSIIPLSAGFRKSSNPDDKTESENGYVIFYHDSNDRLNFSHRNQDNTRWEGYYLPILGEINLPTDSQGGKSSISAFAVARRPQDAIPTLAQPTTIADRAFTLLPSPIDLAAADSNQVRPAIPNVMATAIPTPGPEGYTTGWLAPNGVNVGVAYIDRNRQFALLFTVSDITEPYWGSVNTDQVNRLAPPDLYTDIACVTMASGFDADGEEVALPPDQDDEGTVATCFYQSNLQVVRVRWNGEFDDRLLKWDIERMPIPTTED
ncbi:hypothetical protein QBC40DRAFT_333781 [Triangularia verruculosa]|uniref:Uncharacterized protein n=1 Tax=Triangularia verruculosa TaxID=2587418 RepID=A0AAN7AS55_9PEZI|nr:hypothetical protein QBC40DRAFT_333781 [Triangularia verruculosa]